MAHQQKQRIPQHALIRRIEPAAQPLWEPLLHLAWPLGACTTATRGVGKTTLLFLIAWLKGIIRDEPIAIISSVPTIFNMFFSQIATLREKDQRPIWQKTRWFNLAGQDIEPNGAPEERLIIPTPLYSQSGLGKEGAFALSQMLPELLLRLDPSLTQAPVQGYQAVWTLATMAGKILITLGLGVEHMADLLQFADTDKWQQRFDQALQIDPSVRDAVTYFREQFGRLSQGRRDERSQALLSRLAMFSDPVMQAQFGGIAESSMWLDWARQRRKYLIYAPQEEAEETRNFKQLALFLSLFRFIKRFGSQLGGDRSTPMVVMVDEIAGLAGKNARGNTPLASDLDAIINIYSRNFNVHFITSFQEPYQIEDQKLLDSLLSLGTKFYGRLTDPSSARLLADRAIPYDPFKLKEMHWRRVGGMHGWDEPHPIYYSKQEQIELGRQQFDNLPVKEFLVSRTIHEGDKPLPLTRFSLNHFRIPPPDPTVVADVKRRLALRDGVSVKAVLARLSQEQAAKPMQSSHQPATPPAQPTQPREKRKTKL